MVVFIALGFFLCLPIGRAEEQKEKKSRIILLLPRIEESQRGKWAGVKGWGGKEDIYKAMTEEIGKEGTYKLKKGETGFVTVEYTSERKKNKAHYWRIKDRGYHYFEGWPIGWGAMAIDEEFLTHPEIDVTAFIDYTKLIDIPYEEKSKFLPIDLEELFSLFEKFGAEVEKIEVWVQGAIESGGLLKLAISVKADAGVKVILRPKK